MDEYTYVSMRHTYSDLIDEARDRHMTTGSWYI